MPMLEGTLVLDAVSKAFIRGRRDISVLDRASLDVGAGEVVGVWGRRFSGRSTLVRVAGGITRPDAGAVRVDEVDLWRSARSERERARASIAVWHPAFPPDLGSVLYRQVALPVRRRQGVRRAHSEAYEALGRVGIGDCARRSIKDLDQRERVRAALARALVMRPRALLLDDPLGELDVLEAERVLTLLQHVAREDQIAVLLTGSEGQLAGVERHLSISAGQLRGATTPTPAAVVRFPLAEPNA